MRPPTSIQVPGSSTSATSSRAPKMSGVATACPFQCCCGGCGFAAAAEEVGVEQDAGAAIIGGPLDQAQVPVGVEPDIVVQLERIQVIDAGEVDADVSLDDAKGAQVHCVGTDRGADAVDLSTLGIVEGDVGIHFACVDDLDAFELHNDVRLDAYGNLCVVERPADDRSARILLDTYLLGGSRESAAAAAALQEACQFSVRTR